MPSSSSVVKEPQPLLPSGILTGYLERYRLTQDAADTLQCYETSLRVDIMDVWYRSLLIQWRQFRCELSDIFRRETGLALPFCCRMPRSNLYVAYREYHTANQ